MDIFKTLIKDEKTYIRLFWLSMLILLRQSVKDYFQIFLGVPFRLISAKVIENIFNLFNIKSVSENSVLIFENNITNIDYPCSGSALLYYVLILAVIICLIKGKKPDFKLIINLFICFGIAVFLNILRIFILILLSFNNDLSNFAHIIHVPLGIINFLLIAILFFFLLNREKAEEQTNKSWKYCAIITYILCAIFYGYCKLVPEEKTEYKIILHPVYKNLTLNDSEKSLYKKYGAEVQKYNDGKNIIIKIKSKSWQAIHNPDLCLRNQGFKIINSQTRFNDNKQMRMLKTDKGNIYYYYTNGKITTDDYYLRVFKSIFSKDKLWELVIIYCITP